MFQQLINSLSGGQSSMDFSFMRSALLDGRDPLARSFATAVPAESLSVAMPTISHMVSTMIGEAQPIGAPIKLLSVQTIAFDRLPSLSQLLPDAEQMIKGVSRLPGLQAFEKGFAALPSLDFSSLPAMPTAVFSEVASLPLVQQLPGLAGLLNAIPAADNLLQQAEQLAELPAFEQLLSNDQLLDGVLGEVQGLATGMLPHMQTGVNHVEAVGVVDFSGPVNNLFNMFDFSNVAGM